MYKIIAGISMVIRLFVLPNPFEQLPQNVYVTLLDAQILLMPIVLNWIAEPFIHLLSFSVTGLYYQRGGNAPSVGSALYLFFYCVHVALISLAAQFAFSTLSVILIVICYIVAHVGVNLLINRTAMRF